MSKDAYALQEIGAEGKENENIAYRADRCTDIEVRQKNSAGPFTISGSTPKHSDRHSVICRKLAFSYTLFQNRTLIERHGCGLGATFSSQEVSHVYFVLELNRTRGFTDVHVKWYMLGRKIITNRVDILTIAAGTLTEQAN